jgi:hypothetical protein
MYYSSPVVPEEDRGVSSSPSHTVRLRLTDSIEVKIDDDVINGAISAANATAEHGQA